MENNSGSFKENNYKTYALILAGGSGTRLWPLSREEMPKQFLSVCGDSLTLLQRTVKRILPAVPKEHIRVVASGKWRPLINHQLSSAGLGGDSVIEEPEGRNTAPAIALGIAELLHAGASPDDLVLICPSDHLVRDEESFIRAIEAAKEAACAGQLVTFGITPTSPETGFGYIKTSKTHEAWLSADSFTEKPNREDAERYLESGCYYWNGGIFCFRISDAIAAFCEYIPESCPIFDAKREELGGLFMQIPKNSVDYAIMEQARNIACIPLDAGWSDVGSWDAVYENSPHDDSGNASLGNVALSGGRENLIIAHDRLVCGVDLESMIVVDTPDALFISPRGSSQKLRGVVKQLAESGHEEVAEAPMSARPWGMYRVLSKGDRHKIKRIEVAPGRRLSLQYHMHRSEHWVVVRGTAQVTICALEEGANPREVLLHEGESFFVPKGKLHRLENPGRIPLEIIEVQIGEYVGEDDIIRAEDDFKRG